MNTVISFKQMDASPALKEFIEEKSLTLKKYFRGKISVTWNLSKERETRIAHCHLVGNQMDYFGEGVAVEFRDSINEALEKIERQLRKHKEIVKDHLHKNANVNINGNDQNEGDDQG